MRAFGVGALVVVWSTAVHAEAPDADAKPPYALAWVRDDGAEGCPAGRDFADEVTRRLGRSPFDARADRAIEIRVDREGTAYRSHVVVRERDGRVAGQRALSSPNDCAALFSATALAVALLIDPEATLQADARASEAVARFEVPEPQAPPRAPTLPPTASAPRTEERPRGPAGSIPPPADAGHAAAHAVLGLGVVPGGAPGAELSVSKRLLDRLSAGVSALYLAPGDAASHGVTVDVALTAFNLSALVELVDASAFATGVEAGAWLGALHTSVETTASPGGAPLVPTHPGDLLYASMDAGLHARFRLTRGLLLEARALALVPLVRRRLEIVTAPSTVTENQPNSEVWVQPAVGGLGSLGLGVPFP